MAMRMNLLIVDDEEPMLRLLKRGLSKWFDVKTAQSAEEALKIVESEKVDLLLTDEHMTGMKGSELIKKIHEEGKNIPAIMLTGYAPTGTAQEALVRDDLVTILEKPCDMKEIFNALSAAAWLR